MMTNQSFSLRYLRHFRLPISRQDEVKMKLELSTPVLKIEDSLTLVNLSLCGLAFLSPKRLVPGAEVMIELSFQKTPFLLPGRVVRADAQGDQFQHAVEFSLAERSIAGKFLQEFIDSFKARRVKDHLTQLLFEEGESPALNMEDIYPAILQIMSDFRNYKELPALSENLVSSTKSLYHLKELDFAPIAGEKYVEVYSPEGERVGFLNYEFEISKERSQRPQSLEALAYLLGALHQNRESGIFEESVRFLNPTAPRRYVMIGGTGDVDTLREVISKTKFNHSSVFISGEFGVGKTLMAKIIHSESLAADQAFAILDFTHSYNKETLELFFEELSFEREGTLVIREVQLAAKEVLECLKRELANKKWHQKWRIITTSQLSLGELCDHLKESHFLNSLATIQMHIPPLRQRREDVAPLLTFFLKRECLGRGLRPKQMTRDLVHYISHMEFENNIYALKQFVSRLVDLNLNANLLTFAAAHRLSLLKDEHFQVIAFEGVLKETSTKKEEEQILKDYYHEECERILDECAGDLKQAAIRLGLDSEEEVATLLKDFAKVSAA